MIKGLYYRYQPNGLAVAGVHSIGFWQSSAGVKPWSGVGILSLPVGSLWALTLRNKGKGEGQKLWIKKEHKNMP